MQPCECRILFSTQNCLGENPLNRPDRCRDSENTDSYLPCSLALFSVHLQSFQKEYGAAMKVSVGRQHTAASEQEDGHGTGLLMCVSLYLPQFSVAVAVVAVLCSFGAIRRAAIPRS